MNHLANSLTVSTSLFVPPLPPRLSYDIQVKYRPSLPDNVKFWKVFENDDELSNILHVVDTDFGSCILQIDDSQQIPV